MSLSSVILRQMRAGPWRSALKMLVGVGTGQAIVLGATPFISRIYLPEQLGHFALFLSVVTIVGTVSTGRVEMAIPLTRSDADARRFGLIAVTFVVVASLVVGFGCAAVGSFGAFGTAGFAPMLWVIPFGVLLFGTFQVQNFVVTRQEAFGALSMSLVIRALVVAGIQIGYGHFRLPGFIPLVVAHLGGQLAASVFLQSRLGFGAGDESASPPARPWRTLLSHARRFWTYGAGQSLVNSVSQNSATLVIAMFFLPEVVGQYSMALRILFLPVLLIANSVRQVIYCELSRPEGKIHYVWRRSTLQLALPAALVVAPILGFGPQLFDLVLGPNWGVAGQMAQYLVPWIALTVINPPSTAVLQILGLQRTHFVVEVLALVARLAAIVFGGLAGSVVFAVAGFAGVGTIANGAIIFIAWRNIRHGARLPGEGVSGGAT